MCVVCVCVCDFVLSALVTKYFCLSVPPPNITLYQPVPHPDTGSGHNISCSVIIPTGVNPSLVRIDWIKDSTTVANSSRVSVIDSYDGSVLTKTVIFQQLLAADNGTYRCNVTVNRFTDPRTDVIIVNGEQFDIVCGGQEPNTTQGKAKCLFLVQPNNNTFKCCIVYLLVVFGVFM